MSIRNHAFLVISLLVSPCLAQAGAISGGSDNPLTPAVPFILKEIKSSAGGGHCMITPKRLWITNTDGVDGEDNGMKLALGSTLKQKIEEASGEIVERGLSIPGERVYVYDGHEKFLLMDGDLGKVRTGNATQWLLNTVQGLCNSLR